MDNNILLGIVQKRKFKFHHATSIFTKETLTTHNTFNYHQNNNYFQLIVHLDQRAKKKNQESDTLGFEHKLLYSTVGT